MVGLAVSRRVALDDPGDRAQLGDRTLEVGRLGIEGVAGLLGNRGQECGDGVGEHHGNWWLPIRATAEAIAVTALSSWIIDPWPARPRAVSRIHSRPFSAVSMR